MEKKKLDIEAFDSTAMKAISLPSQHEMELIAMLDALGFVEFRDVKFYHLDPEKAGKVADSSTTYMNVKHGIQVEVLWQKKSAMVLVVEGLKGERPTPIHNFPLPYLYSDLDALRKAVDGTIELRKSQTALSFGPQGN